MTLTTGGLFAGLGGLERGLGAAGMTCRWLVEYDERLQELLRLYWPEAGVFGDVRSVGAADLGYVDVLAGGFPCQPISQAGQRKGKFDERWLWPEFARLVRELRPRYVVVENVAALLRPYEWPKRSGRWHRAPVEEVLGDLAAFGYDAEWTSLRASDVGAPHERERVFIVAYPHRGGHLHGQPQVFAREALDQALADVAASCEAVADASRAGLARRGIPVHQRGSQPADADPEWAGADERPDRTVADTEGECGEVRPAEEGSTRRPTGGGALAYPAGERHEGPRQLRGPSHSAEAREGQATQPLDGCSTEVADTDGGRREQCHSGERRLSESDARGQGAAESELGGDVDGLADRLHGAAGDERRTPENGEWPGWPAPPGPQYAYEPPRVTTQKGREARLRALGNAVVPQVAEVVARLIAADAERLI